MVYTELLWENIKAGRSNAIKMLGEKGVRANIGPESLDVMLGSSHLLLKEHWVTSPMLRELTGLNPVRINDSLDTLTTWGIFDRKENQVKNPGVRSSHAYWPTEFGETVLARFQESSEEISG